LVELRALLAERDVHVAVSTLWRFFDRRRITFKKRPRTPASRAVQMS
jgi:transposase